MEKVTHNGNGIRFVRRCWYREDCDAERGAGALLLAVYSDTRPNQYLQNKLCFAPTPHIPEQPPGLLKGDYHFLSFLVILYHCACRGWTVDPEVLTFVKQMSAPKAHGKRSGWRSCPVS